MQLIRKRKIYNPEQFVGREAEQAYLRGWMAGQKQLLTITGPPGIGKTWFVNNSYQRLKTNGQIAYMVELPITDPRSDQNDLPPEVLQSWGSQLLIELNQDCPQAYSFELGQEFSSLLERIAHDICQRCWPGQGLKPVVSRLGQSSTSQQSNYHPQKRQRQERHRYYRCRRMQGNKR
jgi:hypothetical protein